MKCKSIYDLIFLFGTFSTSFHPIFDKSYLIVFKYFRGLLSRPNHLKTVLESWPPLLLPWLASLGWGSVKLSLANCVTLFIRFCSCFCRIGWLLFCDGLYTVTWELMVVYFDVSPIFLAAPQDQSHLLWGFLFSTIGLHVSLLFLFQSMSYKIWDLYDTKLFPVSIYCQC